MKTAKRITIVAIVFVTFAISFTSCELLGLIAAALFSAEGQIVDARDTANPPTGVTGVSITLTAIAANEDGETPEYTGQTGSDGSFIILDVESGTYNLVAAKDGWFIPPTIVTISGLAVDLNPIPAFELDPDDAYGLSFILSWNSQVDDLDIHMTFPTSWTDGSMATPYDGFPPNPEEVFYNDKTYVNLSGETVVYMDRDDRDGLGPETMTLVRIPHSDTIVTGTSVVSSANDANGLYTAFGTQISEPIDWVGTAALYLNAYTDFLSAGEGTASAEAVVYAIQTLPKVSGGVLASSSDMKSELLGIYRVPDYTKMKSASMLRINMFVDTIGELFQIVPDIRVIPNGTVGFLSSDAAASAIIGVRGRDR